MRNACNSYDVSPRPALGMYRGVRPNRAADFRGPPILASFIYCFSALPSPGPLPP